MNDAPPSVYKYLLPDRAAGLLDKLLIHFSQASVLNDALEFKPLLKGMGTQADVEAGVRERLKEKHPESLSQVAALLPPDKAEKLIAEVAADYADVVEANYDKSVKKCTHSSIELRCAFSLRGPHQSSDVVALCGWWPGLPDRVRSAASLFLAKRDDSDSFRHLRKVKYEERVPAYS